jgi:hypothetical protein
MKKIKKIDIDWVILKITVAIGLSMSVLITALLVVASWNLLIQ